MWDALIARAGDGCEVVVVAEKKFDETESVGAGSGCVRLSVEKVPFPSHRPPQGLATPGEAPNVERT